MTEQEAVAKIKALADKNDPEKAHVEADKILCELLTQLGFTSVVAEFHSLKKWY